METEFPISMRELAYLKGEKLSNGDLFTLSRGGGVVFNRNDWLVELSKSKKILHMGCADHIELIKRKRSQGTYLHDLLVRNASHVVGLDTNSEALEAMKELGIDDLYLIRDFDCQQEFDFLFVPDVIEHVANVGEFLHELKKYKVNRWVFTTPNSYRLTNRNQFRSELINTDHRYWFSPYTLAKSLYENGYQIESFILTDNLSWRRPISRFLKYKYPLCRDGLAVVAYPVE